MAPLRPQFGGKHTSIRRPRFPKRPNETGYVSPVAGAVGVLVGAAYPDAESWLYASSEQRFPFFQAVAVAIAPVLPIRMGQLPLEPLAPWVNSEFFPFPYQPSIPSSIASIPLRMGQIPGSSEATVPPAGFQRFPYLAANLFPASPVIPPRSRPLAELEPTPIPEGGGPRFQRFPYLAANLFPASPVLPPRIRALSELDEIPLPIGSGPRFQRFPYLAATLFPSYPIIGYRYGQSVLVDIPAWVPSQFVTFPWQSTAIAPAIPPRMGQCPLESQPALVSSSVFPFPYFTQPAIPTIVFRYGQLPLESPVALVYPYVVHWSVFVVAAAPPPIVLPPIPDVIRENYTGPPGRITAPWDYPPMRGNVLRGRP